jgi:hypothetical protein
MMGNLSLLKIADPKGIWKGSLAPRRLLTMMWRNIFYPKEKIVL